MRTTLMTRENRKVERTFENIQDFLSGFRIGASDTFAEEDHSTTRTTKRLVSSCRDNISMLKRRGANTSSDQARDMCHVNHEIAADLVTNLTKSWVVEVSAVGASSSYNDLRSIQESIFLQAIIINDTGVKIHTIRKCLKVGRRYGDPVKVSSHCFWDSRNTNFLAGV